MSEVTTPGPRPAPGDPETPGPGAPSLTTTVPPQCPTRTRAYRRGRLVDEGFATAEISERLGADPETVIWLDLYDPDVDDLQVVIDEFGLHPLAVEDAVADRQRPKLDRYDSHRFLNVYATAFDAGAATLTTSEISAFITDRALITVRKAPFDIDALIARWDAAALLADHGVGFLLHGLLDSVVDGQYESVDQLDDAVDDLEECLFERRRDIDIRRQAYDLRKCVVQLRRVVLPMREVLHQLLRVDPETGRPSVVAQPLLPYYQDVNDHVLSTADGVEGIRDLLTGILDTSLNEQTYVQNDITKKLASWAAIIAVPTAVTGFYGQNVPYPGFSKQWGLYSSAVVMAVLAVGLFVLLRRKRWL